MPAATPLSQLYVFPPETPIQLITGVLSDIQSPIKGTGQFGQWSIQNALLSDGGTTVRVVFKDRSPIPVALNGRKVYIQGTDDGKGVKTKDDKGKNKQLERVFWVTKTATVETQDGPEQQQVPYGSATRPHPAPVYAQAPSRVAQPPQQRVQQPAQQIAKQESRPMGPKETIGRMGTVYSLCIRTAIQAVVRVQEDDPAFGLGPEAIKDIATTIFIDALKRVSLEGVPSNLREALTAPTQQPPPEPEPPPLPTPTSNVPADEHDPW